MFNLIFSFTIYSLQSDLNSSIIWILIKNNYSIGKDVKTLLQYLSQRVYQKPTFVWCHASRIYIALMLALKSLSIENQSESQWTSAKKDIQSYASFCIYPTRCLTDAKIKAYNLANKSYGSATRQIRVSNCNCTNIDTEMTLQSNISLFWHGYWNKISQDKPYVTLKIRLQWAHRG